MVSMATVKIPSEVLNANATPDSPSYSRTRTFARTLTNARTKMAGAIIFARIPRAVTRAPVEVATSWRGMDEIASISMSVPPERINAMIMGTARIRRAIMSALVKGDLSFLKIKELVKTLTR